MAQATVERVGSDTVHCGGSETSEAALTFKCHVPGREDLLAARDPGVIVREKTRETERRRERDEKIKEKN